MGQPGVERYTSVVHSNVGSYDVRLATVANELVDCREKKDVGHVIAHEAYDIGAGEWAKVALAIRFAEVVHQAGPFVFSPAGQQFAEPVQLARQPSRSGSRECIQPPARFRQLLGSPNVPVEIEGVVGA
jgi:hypothetical protein